MRLQSLSLENFRSFSKKQIDFSGNKPHVFVGPNGSGKTNILESIAVLSTAKSCLGMEDLHLMTWGNEFFRIRSSIVMDSGDECTLEVASQISPRKQKACFINDVRKPFAGFAGTVSTLVFLPDDLSMFAGSPSRRRSFMDDLLIQLSPEFRDTLHEYERALKQRNVLLRAIKQEKAKRGDLGVWDQQIAKFGAAIQRERIGVLSQLESSIQREASLLQESSDTVRLHYIRKHMEDNPIDPELTLLSLLTHFQERDILLQATSVGPHRDDFSLIIDNRPIELFGSRGQQRTYLLALLFRAVALITNIRNERPIILLDDVFSELDEAHQAALMDRLKDHQVIITATHEPPDISNAEIILMEYARMPDVAHAPARMNTGSDGEVRSS